MRQIQLGVGGTPYKEAITHPYPNPGKLGTFRVPTYRMRISGKSDSNENIERFVEVLRFGVHSIDGKQARIVGLANKQSHVIKSWIPTYSVHSANSPENGAWQVYDSFLIHDGPDQRTHSFATIGCIEIMGEQGFVKFNNLIISLSGATAPTRAKKLIEIGQAKNITIDYEAASRPKLRSIR